MKLLEQTMWRSSGGSGRAGAIVLAVLVVLAVARRKGLGSLRLRRLLAPFADDDYVEGMPLTDTCLDPVHCWACALTRSST